MREYPSIDVMQRSMRMFLAKNSTVVTTSHFSQFSSTVNTPFERINLISQESERKKKKVELPRIKQGIDPIDDECDMEDIEEDIDM